MSNDLIKALNDTRSRISNTELKETPADPNQSSFYALGVWTPTLVGLTIAGTFVYAATTKGLWTRIGNTVFIRGRITLTSVSVNPTGNLTIQGLPLLPATIANVTSGNIAFGFWSFVGLGGGVTTYLGGWIQNGTTNRIDLLVSTNNNTVTNFITGALAGVVGGTDVSFQGQYQV